MIRMRKVASLYGVSLLLAAAIAPHRHHNDLEDLFTDGPSDSGVYVELLTPPGEADGPSVQAARFVVDDPCLACFQHDFAAGISFRVCFFAPTGSIDKGESPRPIRMPSTLLRNRVSRSPPSIY